MFDTLYHGRRAAAVENGSLRITVLREGGHIAEVFDKETGANPLWTPPWPSIEPSAYRGEYGNGVESRLLGGLMGHNLCLDLFGGPSDEEFAAGIGVHGEASVEPYEIEGGVMRTRLPLAGLAFERRIELRGRVVWISESVTNLSATDRPIAWTQHVTLGPPFLEKGVTQFRATATRSKSFESQFGAHDYLPPGLEFDWPAGLDTLTALPRSSAYTTHLMNPAREDAWFVAYSPTHRLAFGYVWKRSDFPWLGIWEENYSRTESPWNGETLARGMEFGVSPFPETRRAMIDRGKLFGVPCYRWIPAKTTVSVEYRAVCSSSIASWESSLPDTR